MQAANDDSAESVKKAEESKTRPPCSLKFLSSVLLSSKEFSEEPSRIVLFRWRRLEVAYRTRCDGNTASEGRRLRWYRGDIRMASLKHGHPIAEVAVAALHHFQFVLDLGVEPLEFLLLSRQNGSIASHLDLHVAHLLFEAFLVVSQLPSLLIHCPAFLRDLKALAFQVISPLFQFGLGFGLRGDDGF